MDHDRFHFGHLFDGIFGAFLAHAALLQPAVGHQVGSPHWPPVDLQIAAIDTFSELHGGVDVLREDPRAQTVACVIRQTNSFINVRSTCDSDSGAKQFVAADSHVRMNIG